MNDRAGPPPVENRGMAVQREKAAYGEVVAAFRAEDGAATRAMAAMLGDEALMQRYLSVVFTALAKQNDLLEKATPASIVQAVKEAAGMGLEPFTPECTIIAYGQVAELRVMYQGELKVIRNSGVVRNIDAQIVYDKDEFTYWYEQDGGHFTHHPFLPEREPLALMRPDGSPTSAGALSDRGGYRFAYAYAVMPDGFCQLDVLTEGEVNFIRDRYGNKAGNRINAWRDAYGEMARKTALHRLRKRLPVSAVMQRLNVLTEREYEQDAAAPAPRVSAARNRALAAVAGEATGG